MTRRRSEAGASGLELAIIVPGLLAVVMLIVGLARMADARQEVTNAAHEAARAASLDRAGGAGGQGRAAAERSLADRGMSCAQLSVTVDTSNYQAGGAVTASVVCTARLSDLALAGMPGTKTYQATSTVPIEQFRSD